MTIREDVAALAADYQAAGNSIAQRLKATWGERPDSDWKAMAELAASLAILETNTAREMGAKAEREFRETLGPMAELLEGANMMQAIFPDIDKLKIEKLYRAHFLLGIAETLLEGHGDEDTLRTVTFEMPVGGV